ncbi:MAG: M48 family metallopeptidase [Tannerella sp.]|jgi:predicted metal-dependent hydrolase|nr:M48 family metallopeptidase [Tannerella sp.]
MEKKINGGELGMIIIRQNPRERRFSLRIKEGQIIATMPYRGDERKMLSFIEEHRENLLHILRKNPKRPLLDEQTELQTYTFRLHLFRSPRTNFYMTLKEGVLHIACPEQTDFKDKQTQEILGRLLKDALRHEAKRILPNRLKELAERHRFSYEKVAIRDTESRWGSCSMQKHISLSLSLMLLPEHLIDYVLLHELCHTLEMNHSERFWLLMNRVTDGNAQKFRREMKHYQMLPNCGG